MDNFMMNCDTCEATTQLTPESLKELKYKVQDEELVATVFTCSNCGDRVLVQIDNEETQSLLYNYKRMAMTRTVKRQHGSDVTPKYLNQMSGLQKRLDIKRKDLNAQYWEAVTCLLMEDKHRNN